MALIEPAVRELPSGYLGPEPIKGHGPHHYTFQLFALGAVLARGRLTGVYER